MIASRTQQIEKEQIAQFLFPKEEVLKTAEEMAKRKADLERAMTLGNLEHIKIRIVFEDNEGTKQVETTVWGLTDKRIILKQGLLIPIHRIKEVIL